MSLQGTLKTLGITELLEFLSDRSASGRLDVTTEMGTASFGFVDGLVAESDYSFIRESGVDAAEATYYVVSELDGTFYFDEDRAPDVAHSGEDVGGVLARTVDIAEKWTDVEEVIPSPNHLLIRNEEIDGSVTIQPEWWKALQMIGEGSTSLQLASALQLSALDASLTALAMTKAGLLIVRELDPLDIELDVEPEAEHAPPTPMPAPVDSPVAETSPVEATTAEAPPLEAGFAEPVPADPEPAQSADVHHLTEHAGFSFHEAESFDSSYDFDAPYDDGSDEPVAESPFQPVDMLEMVDVEAPTPHFAESTPDPIAEPTMSFSDPAMQPPAPVEQQPVDEFAGASGMDDLSELEYVLEPDGHGVVDLPAAASPVDDDDDGWSNSHESFNAPLEPMAAPAPVPAPAPVEASHGAPEPLSEPDDIAELRTLLAPDDVPESAAAPSPFDAIDPPVESSPFDIPAKPVPDVPSTMELADLPAPPPPAASTLTPRPIPEGDHAFSTSMPEASEIPTSATEMAGEVLDDLASMTDELESRAADPGNWELDGTFPPDENTPPPSVEGDPFGDLGELLNDRSGDERSSVLKFLRRD